MSWDKFLAENPHVTVADIAERTQGPPLEIISTDDLEPSIDLLYQRGRDRGFETGWVSVDTHFRIAPQYWTLVTGWPSHGKSGWVDNLAVNTMRKHDWRWLFFSAESLPYESHWASLAELYIQKPFNLGMSDRMTPTERDHAKAFMREHCWHVIPDDRMTVKRIIDVSERAVKRYAINCLVIDPWNELDHSRPIHMNETEYVSNALTQIRRFARNSGSHVFVVAHPAKMNNRKSGEALPVPTPHDVAGSSHFWNKADYAICIWRDLADEKLETHVYVQKARHRYVARVGRVSLFYDLKTGTLRDPYNQAGPSRQSREPGDEADEHLF